MECPRKAVHVARAGQLKRDVGPQLLADVMNGTRWDLLTELQRGLGMGAFNSMMWWVGFGGPSASGVSPLHQVRTEN